MLLLLYIIVISTTADAVNLEQISDNVSDNNAIVNNVTQDKDIVITVGELVDMFNNEKEENEEEKAKKLFYDTNSTTYPKQTQNVDFKSVVDAAEEKKCVEKVVLEEQTEWDQEIQCHHRYRQHCYKSYITAFNPIQEEECNDNYKKNCYIQYGIDAHNQTVRICKKPLVKDCDVQGEELCTTHYQSECWTQNIRKEVSDDIPECLPVVEQKCVNVTEGYTTSQQCSDVTRLQCNIKKQTKYKYQPVTECKLEPVEICAPAGCGVKEGEEICYDRKIVVVYDKPEETCNLESFKTCQFVTKLVPHLKDKDQCVDIPLEICVRYDTNPHTVSTPVVNIWCYKPSKQSGLL